jgi:hypothetical protein
MTGRFQNNKFLTCAIKVLRHRPHLALVVISLVVLQSCPALSAETATGQGSPLLVATNQGAQLPIQAGQDTLSPVQAKQGLLVPIQAEQSALVPAQDAGTKPAPVRNSASARTLVFELDRDILLEFVKFMRFKLRFCAEANKSGFWRSWIYPIEQETGTSFSFSNTLTDLSQRARGLNDPDLISRPSVKRGLSFASTGQTITAASSSIELLHNGYISWLAAQNGFSPRKSEQFVGDCVQKIDALLAQRNAIMATYPDVPDKKSLMLQGKLLKHIRNQFLLSFKRASALSREQEWSENTFYAIDIGQALCQLSGSIASFKGFSNPTCTGAAAILNVVGTSLVTVNPIVRTTVGKYIGKRQRRHLNKVLPQERLRTMDELRHDWNDYADIMPAEPKVAFKNEDITIKELGFLCMQSQEGDEFATRENKEIARLRRVADQQEIAGPLIGLAGLARATCSTVAYYGYKDDRIASNRISFAGRISQSCGQAYGLIATPRAKIKSVIYSRRLKREGRLPSQIYAQQMKKWDAIEVAVKAAKLEAAQH